MDIISTVVIDFVAITTCLRLVLVTVFAALNEESKARRTPYLTTFPSRPKQASTASTSYALEYSLVSGRDRACEIVNGPAAPAVGQGGENRDEYEAKACCDRHEIDYCGDDVHSQLCLQEAYGQIRAGRSQKSQRHDEPHI